jgi:hypothetical protein
MLMNLSKTNIGFIMVAIVAISVGSTYALTNNFAELSAPAGALLTGNVKVTQYDGDGNIVAFRQTDNHIVAKGMELIMRQVFDDVNATAYGFGPSPDPWAVAPTGTSGQVKWMEIGIGGENRLLYNDTNINMIVAAGCLREDAVIENVSSEYVGFGDPANCVLTGMQQDCRARMNVTAMASFSGMTCASGAFDIDEAGMFNHATSGMGEMFSRNTFGGVVLQAPDTLTLDWEFTFSDAFP